MGIRLPTRGIAWLIAALLLLAVACPAWAPVGKKSKVQIDSISFDFNPKEYVISISTKWGIATASPDAGFTVRTTLDITLPAEPPIVIGPQTEPVEKQPGAVKDSAGMAPIVPQRIPWNALDQSGDPFEGTATVTARTELLDADGEVLATAVRTDPVPILPPP